jgi:hypothetical protein
MALDKLTQVGKKLARTQQKTRDTRRYVSENLFSVEKSSDVMGVLYPYRMEFKIYGGKSALLTLAFYEKFKVL